MLTEMVPTAAEKLSAIISNIDWSNFNLDTFK
jgi:hypothetical protein